MQGYAGAALHACGGARCSSTAAFVLLLRTCGRWCDLRLGLALCCAGPISSSLSSSSGHMSSRSYRAMRAVMRPDLLLLLMGPPPLHRACTCKIQISSWIRVMFRVQWDVACKHRLRAPGQQIPARVNLLRRNRTRCIRARLLHYVYLFCTTRIALSRRLHLLLNLAL